MRRLVAFLVIVLGIAFLGVPGGQAHADDDGLALTPPMGWNSWNKFHCDINEATVKGVADAIVSAGLDDLGYRYVTVDDCWMASSRNSAGALVGDPVKFPSGMKALGDYLHARGLKFGLYESPTQGTCQIRPGSYGHEQQDANTFASWGVDYLKYDWCQTSKDQSPQMWADFPGKTEKEIAQILFTRMSDALHATGRPIVYSLSACCSALDFPSWAGSIAHLWRTSTDISDSWSSVMYNYERAIGHQAAAGPGGWNDPDMLEVGNGGMTDTEYRSHFSLWAMLAAPLIMGHDVRSTSTPAKTILANQAVVDVDQDSLGEAAHRVWTRNGTQLLVRSLANGDKAVALLNTGTTTASMSTTLTEIGLPAGSATLTDLWSGTSSNTTGTISASVPGHGTVLYRVRSAGNG